MRKVAIIDYGVGNLTSIANAVRAIGADPFLCSSVAEMKASDSLILPGVGSFPEGMINLKRSGLDEAIVELAQTGKPILGICLGMQLLAAVGEEFGVTEGLSLIPGRVCLMTATPSCRLPHIGWNDVVFSGSQLAKGLGKMAAFYFIHSYGYDNSTANYVKGTCEHGSTVVSIVEFNNVFGTQFHPEKSQRAGQIILKNFLKLC